MNKRFGKNDVIYLSILAVVLLAGMAFFYGNWNKAGDTVIITVDGNEFGRYPLSLDQDISITSENGTVTNQIRIEKGIVRMIEADCPDQLCMHQHGISRDKENIVCLPNRVVITIESGILPDIDAVAD